jgi:DNA-binding HxlR family transcriptional regulator
MVDQDKNNDREVCCPLEKTFSVISSKWTLLILRELAGGTKRFGQLKNTLHGISPKTLTQRLRDLEKSGILSKTLYPEIPPKVEYQLTTKGRSLREILIPLAQWGVSNFDDNVSPEPACSHCDNLLLCGQCIKEK